MKIPFNEEHYNAALVEELSRNFSIKGWSVEKNMEEDGIHLVLTRPNPKGDGIHRLEFYDL